jgi:acylphosphatase
MPTIHLIIKGKVQGVFFRATAKDVADKIGVQGWVKNTEEGHVEIMASGSDEQLQQFMAWCRMGPKKAIVTDVVLNQSQEERFGEFKITHK